MIEEAAAQGLTHVLNYDNIAIVVLMVIVLLQQVFIAIITRGLLKMKDVFHSLALAINTLNERLNRHD